MLDVNCHWQFAKRMHQLGAGCLKTDMRNLICGWADAQELRRVERVKEAEADAAIAAYAAHKEAVTQQRAGARAAEVAIKEAMRQRNEVSVEAAFLRVSRQCVGGGVGGPGAGGAGNSLSSPCCFLASPYSQWPSSRASEGHWTRFRVHQKK